MCRLQSTSKEASVVGFDPLPVRMGMGGARRGLRETYRVPSANKEVCLRKHRLLTLLPLRGFHINEHWNMIAEVSPKLERIQLRLI